MKNILLLLGFFTLFSCTSDNEVWNNTDIDPKTRGLAEFSNYYFEHYNNEDTFRFDFLGKIIGNLPYIVSYNTDSTAEEGYNDVSFELVSKPEWVDSVINATVYKKIRIAMPLLKNNNSVNERIGRIVLRQKESDKILSFNIVQSGTENRVVISVREFSKNHPVFTATTIYPVKKEITCRIPYEAYNDGGKYDGNASITIPKGETKGTYEMDYNGSPLVDYHGDIKGYKLYEGTTTGDDIYTYSFVRYW